MTTPIKWEVGDMLEVTLAEPDDFLKVMETLQRIGIPSTRYNRQLTQTCHILHKRGRYYIVHFKEMFLLDGKDETELTDLDVARRNIIANLLEQWNLVKVVDRSVVQDKPKDLLNLKIIPHKYRKDWKLKANYVIAGRSHDNRVDYVA